VILNKPIFGIIFNLLGDENLFKTSIEIITELFTDPEVRSPPTPCAQLTGTDLPINNATQLDEKSVIAAIQSVLMLRDLYNAAAKGSTMMPTLPLSQPTYIFFHFY